MIAPEEYGHPDGIASPRIVIVAGLICAAIMLVCGVFGV